MQKKKVFLNLLLVGVVILGIGSYCYLKNSNNLKCSNVESFKYNYDNSSSKVWGRGIDHNGLETCHYKEGEKTVYR